MPFQDRQIFKFVKDVTFTPDGESAVSLPGIVRVEVTEAATTAKTQVANNIYQDDSITQTIEFSATVVCQDVDKWDESTGNLRTNVIGALAWKNENHANGADETRTLDVAKLINVSTPYETASGAQELTCEFEVYSDTGTASPMTKA